MITRLRKFFVTTLIGGLIVTLPIAILIGLTSIVWNFLKKILRPITDYLTSVTDWSELIIYSIVFIGLIILFFFVGIFVRTRFGKAILNYIEREWLSAVPFYNTIKETVQQFAGSKETPFSQVVLVDVFNTGTRMTGFVTDRLSDSKVTVFVPTGPNPTNGFIFHVSEDQILHLDASTEEAMRSVIGVGVGSKNIIDRSSQK